ncbi:hypothetical protein DEU56DRAFT_759119 [Suillus clintonianus]|uniref:uncharacterized protein n=1 Tax=Suillus clintonianus TaxID=1904413 RepID=UPI001B877EBF|nr:uncharacterized protein DEU56DRAFT_759119 [Suillus clintonianus]KAG2125817.1 hypothetical protein DEU56DRAFT_759119 [Suillus clintonianus]
MAPFKTQPIKSLPATSILIRSDPSQSGSMDRHTIIGVVVMVAIFLGLILSLSALAWFRPTSLSSFRAIPVRVTSVPTSNTATPVHSTATPGRSISSSRRIFGTFSFYWHWWTQASRSGIPRSTINVTHHESTLSRVAQSPARASLAGRSTEFNTRPNTRSPSFATFAPSIDNTLVDSEAVELHTLGGIKTPSTSSLADNGDTIDNQVVVLPAVVPIAHEDASLGSGGHWRWGQRVSSGTCQTSPRNLCSTCENLPVLPRGAAEVPVMVTFKCDDFKKTRSTDSYGQYIGVPLMLSTGVNKVRTFVNIGIARKLRVLELANVGEHTIRTSMSIGVKYSLAYCRVSGSYVEQGDVEGMRTSIY